MRATDIVGRKIVDVRQSMFNGNLRSNSVDAIILDNGMELQFVTLEGEGEYATNVIVVKPKRKK